MVGVTDASLFVTMFDAMVGAVDGVLYVVMVDAFLEISPNEVASGAEERPFIRSLIGTPGLDINTDVPSSLMPLGSRDVATASRLLYVFDGSAVLFW